ncbi:chemotaxis protein [Marinobacter sp.]|uniref:chemotaxis protein n=1 Tax=Marinobacter sp. TaxID=50741 RepID=UPI00384F6C5A
MSSKTTHAQKLLLFRLTGGKPFALGTLKVREISPFVPLVRMPHSHPAVVGAMTFRGSAIPVIDMAAAVGSRALEPEERKTGSIIVTDIQRREVGFLVRGVDRIVDTDWKSVTPPPPILGERAFVTGLVTVDGETIQLLDVELLLSLIYPVDGDSEEVSLTDVERERLKLLNILLVDDSHVARKQLSDVLDSKHIPYQVTTNGSEALNIMLSAGKAGKDIDLLVSDIEMPGLDGYELAFNIRDNGSIKQPYIILHTSLNSEMSLSYANQVGANEALTKFDAEELLHAMLRGATSAVEQ